jgi:hypothetical protein
MTRRVGGFVFIEREEPAPCELCGQVKELRPYGPGGKRICYQCMKQDEDGAKRTFMELLDGATVVPVDVPRDDS